MSSAGIIKRGSAPTLKIGPFVDSLDGNTAETALTISQADVRLSKNGANIAQKNEATSCTHDELGYYDCPLDATDTNTFGILDLMVHESGALPVKHSYMVLPSWFPGAVLDTTIATLASQTSFTLTAGSADNSAYLSMTFVIFDATTGVQVAFGRCSAYTGSTKTVTLATDPGIYTMAVGDTVVIYPELAVKPTTTTGTRSFAVDQSGGGSISVGTSTGQLDITNGTVKVHGTISGTSDSGTTTTMVDAALTQGDTDWFKGSWILFTSGTVSGQCRLITAFTPGTDTVTFAPATTAAVSTQTYVIIPAGAINVGMWNATAVPTEDTAGYPKVTIKDGTGTGEIATTGGKVDGVILVDTLTTYTGNTVQTGDSFARLGAPAGASVSADIAVIEAQTDDIGVAGAGLTDLGGMSTTMKAQVQTEAEDALVTHRVDELLNADSDIDGAAPPTVGSVFHELMSKTAGSFTFDQTTDSLEAVRDKETDIETDTQDIQARLPAALVSGRMDSNMQAAANGVITAAVIATDAIDADAMADGAITAATFAASAIDATAIAANAITSAKIATDAIGAAQIAANAIGSSELADGCITAAKIATDAIDADSLAADVVTELGAGLGTAAGQTLILARIGSPTDLGSGATIAANMVDIEAQTDDIGAAGAGLTALATQASVNTIDDFLDTEIADIQARLPAALVSGRIDASVGAMAANVLTASALASDAVLEIIDALPNLLQRTTIATLTSQTVFTLTAGSADANAYNGAMVMVVDASTSTQRCVGFILDYVVTTKSVTLIKDPGVFTMAVGDTVYVLAFPIADKLAAYFGGAFTLFTVNGSATTTSFTGASVGDDSLSGGNDRYNGMYVQFLTGSNKGNQPRAVTDYVGGSLAFSFTDDPFESAPSSGDLGMIIGRASASA